MLIFQDSQELFFLLLQRDIATILMWQAPCQLATLRTVTETYQVLSATKWEHINILWTVVQFVLVSVRTSFLGVLCFCDGMLQFGITQCLPVRVYYTRIMTDTQKKKKKPWLVKADKVEKSDRSEKLQTNTEKSQTKSEKHYSKSERIQVKQLFQYAINITLTGVTIRVMIYAK